LADVWKEIVGAGDMTYLVGWKSILTRSNQNNSRASSFVFAIGRRQI